MLTGRGEQVLRQLANPKRLQISSFVDTSPRGFGLVQRKRKLTDYDDLEAHYERRPSLWVEPIGDWGDGQVQLLEIPTKDEVHDNIAAFWRPKQVLSAKSEINYTCRLHWLDLPPIGDKLARFVDFRTGAGTAENSRVFVLDCAGEALKSLPADAPPRIAVSADKGKILNPVALAAPELGGWRLSFELQPEGADAGGAAGAIAGGRHAADRDVALSMDGLTAAATLQGVPEAASLEMPVQSLRRRPERTVRPASSPRGIAARRLLVVGGAVVLTAAATREMVFVLGVNGLTPLAYFILALFVSLFAWIALALTSAICGFVSVLAGGGRASRLGSAAGDRSPGRTALLMPVYNEAPARVMAALEALHGELAALGAGANFDFFILSDTRDPDAWVAEEAAFLLLRERTGGNVFYRRRAQNTERKAGNIAGWVRQLGRRLRAFPDPGRRQRHDRRRRAAAGGGDGADPKTPG